MEFRKLFIPGPVDVSPDVLERMCQPVIGHRSKEATELTQSIVGKMQRLMFTKNAVFISSSSGSGLMEATVMNCVDRRCLHAVNGVFAQRWYDMSVNHGKDVGKIDVEWGNAVTPERVDESLGKGDYEALFVTHNETSTGVATPLEEIGKIAREHGVMFMVDAVSSMGGVKIDVDKLGIDVCVTSTQKCLALPPGLSVCSVSDRAMEKARSVKNRGFYFDFLTLKKYFDEKPWQHPYTPAVNIMYAMDYQLGKILDKEGLDKRFKRHAEMAELTQKWADKRFALLPGKEIASKTVTCIKNTRNIDVKDLKAKLAKKGYEFSNGYGKLKDITFRVAHMGDRRVEDLRTFLNVIDETLGLR